jgi:hypothetical protein
VLRLESNQTTKNQTNEKNQIKSNQKTPISGAKLCSTGLSEAVERMAHSGSFEWLRITPILSRFNAHPSTAAVGKRFLFLSALMYQKAFLET